MKGDQPPHGCECELIFHFSQSFSRNTAPAMENIKIIRITLRDARRKNECGKKDFSDIVHSVEN